MDVIASVRVFGRVRAWLGEAEVSVPNARAERLLTALVLARGEVVGTDQLVQFLWPAAAPVTAANQLHRLVGQVRRTFEPGLPARSVGSFIAGSSVGYRLDLSLVDSDWRRCDEVVAQAREHAAREEWGPATEDYEQALQIVRLPLMGDTAVESGTHSLLTEASRTRAAIAEAALDSASQCGRLETVTSLVEQVAAALPFDENLQAKLIRALGHTGRRRDAMALYERVRLGLVDDLGVDPGAELRAAQAEVLALHAESSPEPGDSGREQPPGELPARVRGYLPRPEVQRVLDEIADRGEAGAVLITAIGGMGGIGKTALAVAWARELASRFPDGQLYVNLRGFDAGGRVMTAHDALHQLLASLGADKAPTEQSLEALSARFRSIAAGRSMLLLLDNARDAEQVRPLLPGHEGCLVIVTSRNQLPGLVVHEGAVPVRLDRMGDDQARQLLTERVGVERLGSDEVALGQVIGAAAGLPLALAIVAARLAVDPDLTLGMVADELAATAGRGGLVGYSVGRDDLASVFGWSYDLLEPEEAHLFRCVGVHPGSELSVESIASLAGVELRSAVQIVGRLVEVSLLERRSRRYVVHDLLREFAAGLLEGGERRAAQQRLVAHYVHTTRNAWSAFGRTPVGDVDPVDPTTPVHAERFADHYEALDWYVRERDVLISILHLAVELGLDRAVANIVIDWRPMNQDLDAAHESYPLARMGLDAALRVGDEVLIAELHRDVAPKAFLLGHGEEGRAHLEQAQALYESLGDRVGQANVLRNIAAVVDMATSERVALLRAALELIPGDIAPQARAALMFDLALRLTVESGSETVDSSAYLEAEVLLRGVLELARAHGWTAVIPEYLNYLARILELSARPVEAQEAAAEALPLAFDRPVLRVEIMIELASAAVALGDMAVAAQWCQEARQLIDGVGGARLRQLTAASFSDSDFGELLAEVESRLAQATASG